MATTVVAAWPGGQIRRRHDKETTRRIEVPLFACFDGALMRCEDVRAEVGIAGLDHHITLPVDEGRAARKENAFQLVSAALRAAGLRHDRHGTRPNPARRRAVRRL